MKNRRIAIYLSIAGICLSLSGCGTKENPVQTTQQTVGEESAPEPIAEESTPEPIAEESTFESTAKETHVPSQEEVLAMRELVLEGMSDEEKERLTENIKLANLRLEKAYLYDDIFEKLSDQDSLYWNYFDQKGDIQIDWTYEGEPVMVYNRFDATNFINLIQDMQKSVQNEMLIADLQQLIDLTALAAETHEMEYANEIYKILHDMDYFLLRYGIEDVGKYTKDGSTVSKYYGVLTVYAE